MITKRMPWWVGAFTLGTVFFLALYLIKPIGVSTQFSVFSGIVHHEVQTEIIQENPRKKHGFESTVAYYNKSEGKLAKAIAQPLQYDFVFDIGIILGGLIAHLFSRSKSVSAPFSRTEESFPSSSEERNPQKLLGAFVGGVFLLYGARLAGGCTSGHMMSGIMQSSVSGILFAMSVFATALLVARWTR